MNKKSVIIIDDEPDIRTMLREFISDHHPETLILEAANGSEGLQKVLRQKFDLVITDIRMPKMDGEHMLKCFTAVDPMMKPENILVLSAHIKSDSMPKPVANITYMGKPFDHEALKRLLANVLSVNPAPSTETPAAAPHNKFKVDVNFINPFIDATLLVLSMTAGVKATKDAVFIRGKDQISGDISAIMAMNSTHFKGSMAIAFEEGCFLHVSSSMLGTRYTVINDENQDAAGEICNQVFGNAKTVLNKRGLEIQPALPSVVTGKSHRIKHFAEGPCIAVRFKTEGGFLTVETVFGS